MLQLINICKRSGSEAVSAGLRLDNLNLELPPQSFTVITGSARAGKTTLINLISGKLLPDSGKIFFNGMEVTNRNESSRAGYIGHVYPNPAVGTIAELTVLDNMLLATRRTMAAKLRIAVTRAELNNIVAMLEQVDMGLREQLYCPVRKLGNGQRQALSLLMATSANRKLLLLDDHTAALSSLEAEIILRLTMDIIEKKHLTTVMISRSLPLALRFGQRLLLMHNGRIITDAGGVHKKRLRSEDLYAMLLEQRRLESIDANTASMLENYYI